MATVRVAHAEPLRGKLPNGDFLTVGHLVVLADDAGRRALPVWLPGGAEPGAEDLARLVVLRDRRRERRGARRAHGPAARSWAGWACRSRAMTCSPRPRPRSCRRQGTVRLPTARARARRLCANPSDVDDIVQESFLRAYLSLDRLRDPDRFPGWLAGIVANVCRALRREPQVALLPDWPEPLHPAAAAGQSSAEDLDRADALRTAVASLPAGQRHAVALHYYADLSAGQAGVSPGAARASLHKARLRLRDYLTEHRPDLISSRRTPMTPVGVARVERPGGQPPPRHPPHLAAHRVPDHHPRRGPQAHRGRFQPGEGHRRHRQGQGCDARRVRTP